MNPKRVKTLVEAEGKEGPVIYWMSRDQRVRDNWALLFAQELARKNTSPVAALFCLSPEFLGATSRQYHFMLRGLKEVEKDLRQLNIPLFLLHGDPGRKIAQFLKAHDAAALVSDFSPLRINRSWKVSAIEQIAIPFYEVDAHNIVPCWVASSKQEWAAYTFRPKVRRLLSEFLEEFPAVSKHPFRFEDWAENDWDEAEKSVKAGALPEVKWIQPGEKAARDHLIDFLNHRLSGYESGRNDPARDAQSGLSPYLHFGHISAQRVALQVLKGSQDSSSFLEELIVRRELSDNFCYYNSNYDSFDGFPDWAKETLRIHEKDRREYIYNLKELEAGQTHDVLWNAAQLEMVHKGKMHGYLRMYWAKKILEWTETPDEALRAAIYLNDKYELDGRDPNGYTGIAWSIGGIHDRAWKEREVFGKVRYMSYKGAGRKFDIDAYIRKVESVVR
ncbi:MAG: deoxyribodipyrimidine photo-lyase [Methanotrichaceae archaeon]|nr:deoxyribodipyrimidine photo-lyase [Methanotrichaceae archaeon]